MWHMLVLFQLLIRALDRPDYGARGAPRRRYVNFISYGTDSTCFNVQKWFCKMVTARKSSAKWPLESLRGTLALTPGTQNYRH